MASKKKPSKKQKKTRKAAVKKAAPKKKTVRKNASAKKPLRKKAPRRKAAASRKVAAKPATSRKKTKIPKKPAQREGRSPETVTYSVDEPVSRPGSQAGDLQGLSNLERADSESVQELLEEGNAFEADVVTGVENADEVREVRTREVPEDDVPEEYLDQD
ncbi:MAG: hypothetical protein ACRD3H_05235 [Terriglobales bacterium]